MARIPYLKLSRLAEDQGFEQQELGVQIGVCKNTISKRFRGKVPWTSNEITAICKVLHIPQEKIGEYFFPTVEKGESA